MVNPGSFRGLRKEFLISQKPEYAAAVRENRVSEVVSQIQRRFFKHFPVDLPEHFEPTAEFLASVDDDAPDIDIDVPGEETVSEEEAKRRKARRKTLKGRKAQITRWLSYQYKKDHGANKGADSVNPYSVLLARLTDTNIKPPRRLPVLNVWRKTKREAIAEGLEEEINRLKKQGKTLLTKDHATTRESIARKLFSELPPEEQLKWEQVAADQYKAAVLAYKKNLAASVSTKPEDRQRAIQALTKFVDPILNMICQATGWKATLIAGGPEPAQEGRLNILSVHSGTMAGDVKMSFGTSERALYQKYIVPIFGGFLQKCYTLDECRERALHPEDGYLPMSALDFEYEHAFAHSVEDHRQQAAPPNPSTGFTIDVSMPAERAKSPGPPEDDNPFPFNLARSSPPLSSLPPSPALSRISSPAPPDPADVTGDVYHTAPILVIPGLDIVTAGGYTSVHFTGEPGAEVVPEDRVLAITNSIAASPLIPPITPPDAFPRPQILHSTVSEPAAPLAVAPSTAPCTSAALNQNPSLPAPTDVIQQDQQSQPEPELTKQPAVVNKKARPTPVPVKNRKKNTQADLPTPTPPTVGGKDGLATVPPLPPNPKPPTVSEEDPPVTFSPPYPGPVPAPAAQVALRVDSQSSAVPKPGAKKRKGWVYEIVYDNPGETSNDKEILPPPGAKRARTKSDKIKEIERLGDSSASATSRQGQGGATSGRGRGGATSGREAVHNSDAQVMADSRGPVTDVSQVSES